jgi:SAM-dependent methyltransferase
MCFMTGLTRRSDALLDVRPEAAFAAGHVAGAANIPLEELPQRTHELPPKGAAVRVFDGDPARQRQAAEALRRRGYAVAEASPGPSTATCRHPARHTAVLGPGCPADLRESGPSRARLWQPSPFLVEALDCIRAHAGAHPLQGRALDVACGAGREAVYLALAGYQVDAIDVLPDALARARDLARRCGVALHTMRQDLKRDPVLPAGRYDLVTVFRFLHRPLLPVIGRSVAAGGYLVYEAFHRRDAVEGAPGTQHGRLPCRVPARCRGTRRRGGGSGSRRLKAGHSLADGELAAAFDGFQVLLARDGVERDGRVFSHLLARRTG